MPKPVIDQGKCEGCGTCAEVCPNEVISMKGGRPEVLREDDCIGCRSCEIQCPAEAIEVED
jgi:2-oxoglutarate ferredoxin oxidoreductase subunit delta